MLLQAPDEFVSEIFSSIKEKEAGFVDFPTWGVCVCVTF